MDRTNIVRVKELMEKHNLTHGQAEDLLEDLESFEMRRVAKLKENKPPEPWTGVLVTEGIPTGDFREK